jgi:hypothetical protein|tara:strand:+ start:14182 stop:14925 length:744 start_codon:yes stop_codon:yes gene_type:complete
VVKFTGGKAKPRKREIETAERSDRPDGLMNAGPVSYPVAQTTITALQVYHNPERKPGEEGPWNDEADKVAWVDSGTGLGCIILRQKDGTLSGYVSVGLEHPLFGFDAAAVPLGISSQVHGGITYGRECEVNRTERRAKGKPRQERYTVCHVTRTRWVQDYENVQTTQDEFEHEDLWWLGFDTNHVGDLVPNDRYHTARRSDVYRDQAYVYENCVALAKRLKAVADRKAASRAADADQALPPPTPETR